MESTDQSKKNQGLAPSGNAEGVAGTAEQGKAMAYQLYLKRFENCAFPIAVPEGGGFVEAWGLTKREYFAAKALQGLVGRPHDAPWSYAALAVECADALLAALARTEGR